MTNFRDPAFMNIGRDTSQPIPSTITPRSDDSIYYLAQPYSYNPARAWRDAAMWTNQLRQLGITVFSPILHTHHYDEAYPDSYFDEDYVQWDLDILSHFVPSQLTLLFASHWQESKGCCREREWAEARGIECLDLFTFMFERRLFKEPRKHYGIGGSETL
jgi:hypothetical protein